MIRKCDPLRSICLLRQRLKFPQQAAFENHVKKPSNDRSRLTTQAGISVPPPVSAPIEEPALHSPSNQSVEGRPTSRRRSHVQQFGTILYGEKPSDLWTRPTKELKTVLVRPGDAQNVAAWLRGRQSPLKPPDFNALQARFQHLGGTVKLEKIIEHILLVSDDPAALKDRLLAYEAMIQKNPDTSYERPSRRDFAALSHYITFPKGDQWDDEYLRQKWMHVITGWKKDGIVKPDEKRAWSLYQLGPELDPACWEFYVRLLVKFGKPEMVCSEWDFHQKKHGSTSGALNFVIQGLTRLDDFKNAWRLAYGSGDVTETIHEYTWMLLLARPEYIKEWLPVMIGPALRMLENEICKVEKSLGLQWEGGINGSHKIKEPELEYRALYAIF